MRFHPRNQAPRALLALFVGGLLAPPAVAGVPTIESLFPAGASRGSKVEVVVTGQFGHWPVRGWSSRPGLTIEAGRDKGNLSVVVAPDASTGLYWIRLFDEEGATAPRAFLVGGLPESTEVEPNDEPSQAQNVEGPNRLINGRLGKSGDVDGYRIHLNRGQTLVASMEANRRLGSPMDGVLQVASIDGFVLAHNDDDHDRDPRIVFKAPADADYIVRAFAFPFVQSSFIQFAGGPSYVYRLTLATGGVIDHVFPMATSPGGPSEVEAFGWNIPEAARKLSVEPRDVEERTIALGHPLLTNDVELRVVDPPSIVEDEPNDPPHSQAIALPVAISGRIERNRDVDSFTFGARKGETWLFRVESRSLDQLLDSVLRISDASGASVLEVDDVRRGADPEARFHVPADGTYRATVRDLNGQGGSRRAYLLVAEAPRPDFAMSLKADQFPLTPGKPAEIVVEVERREGFAEAIEIGLEEHFDGAIAAPSTSVAGTPSASSVTLRLMPCECVRPGPIRVVGISSEGLRRSASTSIPGFDRPWLSVPRPAPPPEKTSGPVK